jgi:hypothetical protein
VLTVLPFSIAISLALCVAREMFRRQGEAGVATAISWVHGVILLLLPVATAVSLQLVAPEYLHSMGAAGRLALSSAGCAQIALNLTIRKVIDVSIRKAS